MKGVVFTEFLEMVEDKFGYDTVDQIIESSNLPNNGAYTSIGTYPHQEIITLVVSLSKVVNIEVSTLVHTFGYHLFGQFAKGYPRFLDNSDNAFSFLESIENYIHVEVKKLYPDAELPKFDCKRVADNVLEMLYTSERAMGDLAVGLIEGCAVHYKETLKIQKVEKPNSNGKIVKFLITRVQ